MGWGKQRPPRIVIGPNAVVDGPLVFEREVTLYVHDSARIGKVTGAIAVRYSSPTPPKAKASSLPPGFRLSCRARWWAIRVAFGRCSPI